jgi:hypothetical protein
MKKLRFVLIGLLLAGAVALVGCSRYNTAHESQGKGRNSELAGRNSEQGGRGQNRSAQDQGNLGSGGFGRQQDSRVYDSQRQGRGGTGAGRGIEKLEYGSAGKSIPEQNGRVVAEKGTLENLSGTLSYDGSEWYLESGKDVYILHFGNSSYVESTGIDLDQGEPIDVRGFVSGDEIAVAAARLDSQVYTFRNEDGTPMWAGRGRRENQIVQPYGGGSGQPRGQGGQGNRDSQGSDRQGRGTEEGTFGGRGSGNNEELQEGRGRGRTFQDSDALPWWYQQPMEQDQPQTQV